jgi:hypothetical protein
VATVVATKIKIAMYLLEIALLDHCPERTYTFRKQLNKAFITIIEGEYGSNSMYIVLYIVN